jgi:hypothetical protein
MIMSLLSAFGTITIRTGTLRSSDMSNSKWTVSTGLILTMTFCQSSAAAAIASLACHFVVCKDSIFKINDYSIGA